MQKNYLSILNEYNANVPSNRDDVLNQIMNNISYLKDNGIEITDDHASKIDVYEDRIKDENPPLDELHLILYQLDSIIYQTMSDEDKHDIDELEKTEVNELDEAHTTSSQRAQGKISRRSNFKLKKAIAARAKKNKLLCNSEYTRWSSKTKRCEYLDPRKSNNLKRQAITRRHYG